MPFLRPKLFGMLEAVTVPRGVPISGISLPPYWNAIGGK